MGGDSAEREISLKTGRTVAGALKKKGYRVSTIDTGAGDALSVLGKANADAAFIALHGRGGEDGSVQGLLEIKGLPYTGSGVLASALSMDKVASKKILRYHGIATPDFLVVGKNSVGVKRMKLPLVVKPASLGSTIGISLVTKRAELEKAVRKARRFDKSVLVESFIKGRELTVSVLGGNAFPIVEIRPKEGFYDFEAKYTKGKVDFIVPAKLNKTVSKKVDKTALLVYEA
ncbi:MAG: D-alanine--D-alanine ligase, partial [Thermodesulfobacteriota bacterium]